MTGDLSRVRCRLEKAVADLPGEPANAEEAYSRFEETAAAILDSEWEQYTPGILETYLAVLCEARMLELGLVPDFHE
ncbi:hypothetical protein [Pseudohalioglobus lutimaris]|uniref:Uncharacterized protein n=1 Tax=Pseudohalioglobus lutimaris TaxID=1737061 RepID=A0A2N5X101_9GAMM|nr:hypothetical protein [Pseudohalioglobus lutimaris]PLW68156.1 hypothetical protein C0039_13250 [Pseudohalioglobus lutimaris]